MKKVTLTALLMAAALPILAASPHFIGPVTATLQGNNVRVCWKEAGLGQNTAISYTASANASATYNCMNAGGNCPEAANKKDVTGPVTTSGTFNSDKNGSISACLVIQPPAGTLTCPGGQTATLTRVTYTGIKITDVTNGIEKAASPATLTATPSSCR